jgi:hypothetical protein
MSQKVDENEGALIIAIPADSPACRFVGSRAQQDGFQSIGNATNLGFSMSTL